MSINHHNKTSGLGQHNLSFFLFVSIGITSTPCYLHLSLLSPSISSIYHMDPPANQHTFILSPQEGTSHSRLHWRTILSDCLWYEGTLSLSLWRLLLNSQTPSLHKEKKPSELNSFAQALTQWSHPRNVGKIKVGCVVLNFHLTLRWDPSVFTSAARITVNRSVRARDLKTTARIPLWPFYSSVNSSFKAHWLIWPQISSNREEQKDPEREIYNCDTGFQKNNKLNTEEFINISLI